VVEMGSSSNIPPNEIAHPLALCLRAYKNDIESGPRMYLLHIHAQSYSRIFEVLPEEVGDAEIVVEEAVGHILVDLFGDAMVDDVTIHFSSASRTGQRDCSIQIQAQCSFDSHTLHPSAKEHMERTVGRNLGSLLREVFGPVTVDSVTAQPYFMESY